MLGPLLAVPQFSSTTPCCAMRMIQDRAHGREQLLRLFAIAPQPLFSFVFVFLLLGIGTSCAVLLWVSTAVDKRSGAENGRSFLCSNPSSVQRVWFFFAAALHSVRMMALLRLAWMLWSTVPVRNSFWRPETSTLAEHKAALLSSLQRALGSASWSWNRVLGYGIVLHAFVGPMFFWVAWRECDAVAPLKFASLLVSVLPMARMLSTLLLFVGFSLFCELGNNGVGASASGVIVELLCKLDHWEFRGNVGGEDNENLMCSICLLEFEPGDELTRLPCSRLHTFHRGCITQWLRRKQACPLCQQRVDREQPRQKTR